jgi:hypothetical protein
MNQNHGMQGLPVQFSRPGLSAVSGPTAKPCHRLISEQDGDMGHMHPDLMGAAGFEAAFDQTHGVIEGPTTA